MITNLNIGYNGRFGNQLFQFASAIGISKYLGFDVAFPKKNISNIINAHTADGRLFNAKLDLTECFDIDEKFFTDDIKINNYKNENHFHFDESMFKISDKTSINGYFQSEKYFKHCKDDIIKILKIKDSIYESAIKLIPKDDKERVAIHVRRSDYLYLSDIHSVNGEDYINLAIKEFGNSNNFNFVVCSDDVAWCESVWGENKNFTIIKTNSPYIDFAAMSLCEHHIIANSSFSWWSSYLSKYSEKKIIAPKNWFGSKMSLTNTSDLYTENMIVI